MSNHKSFEKGDPQFCVIAPTPYLEQFATKSRCHLVLAHIVDNDPSYAAFYRDRSQAGDRIIMDNGAFELGASYEPSRLVDLGNECGADAIVLPDYPGQAAEKTIDASMAVIDEIKGAGFKTVFVPQSHVGDLEDWVHAYEFAADEGKIDAIAMSILGIPNALPYIPAAYARVVMTQLLISHGVFAFNKYHHYLGLNAGPKLEIPALLKMNALDSLDSSNPVWMAILGHEYTYSTDSFLAVSKVKKEVEFNYPLTKDQATLDRIHKNINMTLDLFK